LVDQGLLGLRGAVTDYQAGKFSRLAETWRQIQIAGTIDSAALELHWLWHSALLRVFHTRGISSLYRCEGGPSTFCASVLRRSADGSVLRDELNGAAR
jgi:hypothetical protein